MISSLFFSQSCGYLCAEERTTAIPEYCNWSFQDAKLMVIM